MRLAWFTSLHGEASSNVPPKPSATSHGVWFRPGPPELTDCSTLLGGGQYLSQHLLDAVCVSQHASSGMHLQAVPAAGRWDRLTGSRQLHQAAAAGRQSDKLIPSNFARTHCLKPDTGEVDSPLRQPALTQSLKHLQPLFSQLMQTEPLEQHSRACQEVPCLVTIALLLLNKQPT